MASIDWDEKYQKGEAFWDKGAPAPAMTQYLARQTVRGRALVPGCGRGHEVALAVEHGLDATGLDIAPTGVAEARAQYPHLAERFVTGLGVGYNASESASTTIAESGLAGYDMSTWYGLLVPGPTPRRSRPLKKASARMNSPSSKCCSKTTSPKPTASASSWPSVTSCPR